MIIQRDTQHQISLISALFLKIFSNFERIAAEICDLFINSLNWIYSETKMRQKWNAMQQTVTIGIAKQGHLSMYLNNKFLEKFLKIILLYKKCTNFRNQERAGDGILLPNLSQRKTYVIFFSQECRNSKYFDFKIILLLSRCRLLRSSFLKLKVTLKILKPASTELCFFNSRETKI